MEISEFTETWFEYNYLLRQVVDMDDEFLVDEIIHVNSYDTPDADQAVMSFFDNGRLTEKERQVLINCYILIHCEEEITV